MAEPDPTIGACPDADTLLAFAERRVSADEHAALAAHLDGCAECMAAVCAAVRSEPADDAATDLARGDIVGRYTVLSLLGQGAMGSVYAAYDPQLDRRVALKVARGDRAMQAGTRERLLREAQVMARISDAGVVRIYDAGEVDGRVFLAMELLDGTTLRAWLGERARTRDEIVVAFLAAGRGLAAAHANGIVHRDFKPDNVLVDKAGRIAVADFGLAGAHETSAPVQAGASVSLTGTGALLGTPRYMSPEQHGRRRPDARSDQFSFAVALYAALHGEPPFAGETVEALATEVAAGRVRPAPAGSNVPARTRRALVRALAPDPQRRFSDMSALIAELDEAPRRARRRLVVIGGALAAVLAVAAGFSVHARRDVCGSAKDELRGVWDDARAALVHAAFVATKTPKAEDAWESTRRSLDTYASAWAAAATDACAATNVRHQQSSDLLDRRTACLHDHLREVRALTELLAHADADLVHHATAATSSLGSLQACSDSGALMARVAPPPATVASRVAELRTRLATLKAMYDTDRYAPAKPLAAATVADARTLGYRAVLGEALLQEGLLRMAMDDRQGALDSFHAADLAADAAGDDHTRAVALGGLVFVEGDGGKGSASTRARAESMLERLHDDDDASARLHVALGVMKLHSDHDPRAALVELKAALAERQRLCAGPCLQAASIESHLAFAYAEAGELDAALRTHEDAIRTYDAILGPDQWETGETLTQIGELELALLRPKDAEATLRHALHVWDQLLEPGGDEHLRADTLDRLSLALSEQGRFPEALEAARRSEAIHDRTHDAIVGANGPLLTRTALARAYVGLGDRAHAVPVLEAVVATPDSPAEALADARWLLARLLRDPIRARRLVEQAAAARLVGPRFARDHAEMIAWLAAHPTR